MSGVALRSALGRLRARVSRWLEPVRYLPFALGRAPSPRRITIDPLARCNLRCPLCPTGRGHSTSAGKGILSKLTMYSIPLPEGIGFMSMRKFGAIVSIAAVAIGVGFFAMRGEANFGVDFRTGTNVIANVHNSGVIEEGAGQRRVPKIRLGQKSRGEVGVGQVGPP